MLVPAPPTHTHKHNPPSIDVLPKSKDTAISRNEILTRSLVASLQTNPDRRNRVRTGHAEKPQRPSTWHFNGVPAGTPTDLHRQDLYYSVAALKASEQSIFL